MAPESSRCPSMPASVATSMMRAPISMPGLALRLPLISRTGCGWACGSNSSIRVMAAPGCTSVTRYRRRGRARS